MESEKLLIQLDDTESSPAKPTSLLMRCVLTLTILSFDEVLLFKSSLIELAVNVRIRVNGLLVSIA